MLGLNTRHAEECNLQIEAMKARNKAFAAIAIAAIGITLAAGCAAPSPADVEGTQSTIGFNGPLQLVAKYKPLHLYIYADVTSTNKHTDFIIFHRNEPLVIADNKSNAVKMIFCENNFRGQFTTTYDYEGRILKRSFDTGESMQTNYLYFDTNGDGQWDFLHTYGKNIGSTYVRSNFCWVPKVPDQ